MSISRPRRYTRLRLVLAGGLAAALGAAAFLITTTQGAAAHGDSSRALFPAGATRPVIVLEHGAWADASSWRRVITRLEHDGYTVYAPPNPLRGLPSDSAYLHAFLTEDAALQGRSIVLVGHSYGGAVITNAAVGAPGVRALVYVDAFIPDQGQTLAATPRTCSIWCRTPAVPRATSIHTSSQAWSRAASPPVCLRGKPRSSPPRSDPWPPAHSQSHPGRRPGSRCRHGPWSGLPTRSSRPPSR
jgi:pimeloyl-ACP methyl ester carboxylesterase